MYPKPYGYGVLSSSRRRSSVSRARSAARLTAMVAKMTTSVMMMAYTNCPIKALPVLPKIVVNRFWIAVFHAKAATSPKATVINSANYVQHFGG